MLRYHLSDALIKNNHAQTYHIERIQEKIKIELLQKSFQFFN